MTLLSQKKSSRSLLLSRRTDMPLSLPSSPRQRRMLLPRPLLRRTNRRKLLPKPKTLRLRLRPSLTRTRIRLKTMLSRK